MFHKIHAKLFKIQNFFIKKILLTTEISFSPGRYATGSIVLLQLLIYVNLHFKH